MLKSNRKIAAVVAMVVAGQAALSSASDCNVTSFGLVPLNELGSGLYLGQFRGGLYPNGSNNPPQSHHMVGRARALGITPLNTVGEPSPTGRYVLLSVGMSNTTQEFCSAGSGLPCNPWTFMGQAMSSPFVNTSGLVIVNGARGGQAAPNWVDPAGMNWENIRVQRLQPQGLSEAQVQAIWIKQAVPGPTDSLPNANADAFALEQYLGDIVRAAKVRYPNLKIVFLSSRIYGGYATTALNPEPYAYEGGFAVKWLIEAQINQMNGGGIDPRAGDLNYDTVAPWLAWGPYLWADGTTPRADNGLVWNCADLDNDGTHPAQPGEEKVGSLLLNFMLNSPYSRPWFSRCPVDPTLDGSFDDADVAVMAAVLSGSDGDPNHRRACDLNCDGRADGEDIQRFIQLLLP